MIRQHTILYHSHNEAGGHGGVGPVRSRSDHAAPDTLSSIDDAALKDLIDAAMATVRGEPYAQSLTDPENSVTQGGPDHVVRYYGASREFGYPGTPRPVLEANLGEETITLVSGEPADYDTEAGRLSVAAHIAGHLRAARPTLAQVRALAQAIADAEERDGGGEFRLDAVEIQDILDDAD